MIEEFVLCSNSIFCGQNVQASNEWLVNLSQQDDSWKVFLPIIADCGYGEAALFFAVKLLHRYIQLRWNTLDPAEKSHIIELLAEKLFAAPSIVYTNNLIKNQICLSLSSIFCRISSEEEARHFQDALYSLDHSNPGQLTGAVYILRELPEEMHSYVRQCGRGASMACTISAFKHSILYFFRRAASLLRESSDTVNSSYNVEELLEFQLACVEAVCVWCDATTGETGKDTWLAAADLCSCVVDVRRDVNDYGQCVSDQYTVDVLENSVDGSALDMLCAFVVPFLASFLQSGQQSPSYERAKSAVEKCLGASLQLMHHFLQCSAVSLYSEESSSVLHANMRSTVMACFQSLICTAELFAPRESLVSLKSSAFLAGSRGALCEAVQVVESFRLLIGSTLSAYQDLDELENGQSNFCVVALNFIDCIMSFTDKHLILASENSECFNMISTLVYLGLLLPFRDCALTIVEDLAVMVAECSDSRDKRWQQQEVKVAFILGHLVGSSEEDGLEDVAEIGRAGGVVGLLSCLVSSCRLPPERLAPSVSLTLHPVQHIFHDPLKGLVGYGSNSTSSDYDQCFVEEIGEIRREATQLLKVLWETVLDFDVSLLSIVASGAFSSLSHVHSASGRIDELVQSRTLAEVLLSMAVSMQEIACEVVGLDEAGGMWRGVPVGNEEEEEEIRCEQEEVIGNLDRNKLAVLSVSVEFASRVTDFFVAILSTQGPTPVELFSHYMQMWSTAPLFINALYYHTTEIEFYSCCIDRALNVMRYGLGIYPRDALNTMEKMATSCSRIVSSYALSYAEWLLNYAHASDSLTAQEIVSGQFMPLASTEYCFFRVCGLFLRLTVHDESSSTDSKRQGLLFCMNLVCPALQKFLDSAQIELDSSSRAEVCFRERHMLSRLILRVRGLVKVLLGDEVFTSFIPDICTIMFDIAHSASETYAWMKGRKLNADAVGVDVYIDTGHCHVGEGKAGSDKCIVEIGRLIEGALDLLCSLFDSELPVSTPVEWVSYISSAVRKTQGILEILQLPKIIQLTTVLIRWGVQYEGSDESQKQDVGHLLAELVSYIITRTQEKVDDPLLDFGSVEWLVQECNSCASLIRQVFLVDTNILFCKSSAGQIHSLCSALHFVKLTSSLLNRQSLLAESSIMTPRLFAAVFSKWDPISEILLHDSSTRVLYQQASFDLIVALLVGFFYESLGNKIKNWSELLHSFLSVLAGNGDELSGGFFDIICNACLEVFASPLCRHLCEKWNQGNVPEDAVVVCEQRKVLLISTTDAATSIANMITSSFRKARRRNTAALVENLCSIYRIPLSENIHDTQVF